MKFLHTFFLFILIVGQQFTFSQAWMPVNNPGGGQVTDLYFHTTGEIFAGTINGPFSSSDGGQTWVNRRGNQQPYGASQVRINSLGHMFWQSGYYLYRSTDNGTTWVDLNNGTWPNGSDGLLINTNDDMFVRTNSNIWRSMDNGNSWTALPTVTSASALAVNPQQVLYAGTYGRKIYRSNDNGDNWELIYEDSTLSFTVRDFAFDGPNNIYGIVWNKGAIKSIDAGNTWNYVNNGLPLEYIITITINSLNEIFVGKSLSGGIGGGVYKSSDGGNSWTDYSSGLIDSSVQSLAFNSEGDLLAGTTDGGVYIRDPFASSWISSSTGLESVNVNLIRSRSDGDLFAATSSGVYRSTDGAVSWTWSITGFEYRNIEALRIHPDGSIYAADGYRIYRSTDDGTTWNNVTNNIQDGEVEVLEIAFNSNGDIFLATNDHGVLYSSDDGQTWSFRNNNLPYLDLRTIATNSNNIVFMSDGITTYRSSDSGQNWEEIMNGLPDGDISEFAVGQNDVLLGVTYSDGVFRSTDNGDNWTLTLDIDVNSFAVNGSQIYAGSDRIANGGVYWSVDNGLTWTPKNVNLPSLQVESLAHRPGDKLFALVRDNGIYANDLTTDIRNNAIALPNEYSLKQNYPNPFNPSTKISWQSPVGSHQKIKVYDVLGNEVATLVDEFRPAGSYVVNFDAEGLTSGIYFYKLQTSSFAETKKMILIK